MELPDPGSAAAASFLLFFFFSYLVTNTRRNRARASPELLETATSANGAAAGSRSGGRGPHLGPRPARLRCLVGDVSPPPRAAAFTAVSRNRSQELALSLRLHTPQTPFCRSHLRQEPPSPPSLWELGAQSRVCCWSLHRCGGACTNQAVAPATSRRVRPTDID